MPRPREFKVSLRLITLSQYECQVVRSNYFEDSRTHLISYCKELKHAEDHEDEEKVAFTEVELKDDGISLNDYNKQSLYYLLGCYGFIKEKKSAYCTQALTATNQNNEIMKLTQLKEYKDNALLCPKLELFNFILKAESFFLNT